MIGGTCDVYIGYNIYALITSEARGLVDFPKKRFVLHQYISYARIGLNKLLLSFIILLVTRYPDMETRRESLYTHIFGVRSTQYCASFRCTRMSNEKIYFNSTRIEISKLSNQ